MNESTGTLFVDEAIRLARRIEASAVRHGGRAMWVADDLRRGGTRRVVRTLDADLAGGTAGVGWFLARLAAVTDDPEFAALSKEALRSALDRGPLLIGDHRCGWYEGALGVAWTAINAGESLVDNELTDAGRALADEAVASLEGLQVDHVSLVGGAADVVAGIIGIADLVGDRSGVERATDWSARLAAALEPPPAGRSDHRGGLSAPGLARGTTGVGLALARWASMTGVTAELETVGRATRSELAWYEPGAGWSAQSAHVHQYEPHVVDWSWCAGAAGIGLARLAAYTRNQDVADLADLAAAIEIVRAAMSVDSGSERSLCHGAGGAIDLLLTAGAVLGEPEHLIAAQRAGLVMIERGRLGGHRVVIDPGGEDPTLMFGDAGIGLLMLRLADGGRTPTPTLPPFLLDSSVVATR